MIFLSESRIKELVDRLSPTAKPYQLKGSDLPQSRLTESQVRKIKKSRGEKTIKETAKDYGVHYRTIEKIYYGKSWAHV